MSGEDLYEYWTLANAEQNCSVDGWQDLDEFDQACWGKMAELLGPQLADA